MDTYNMTFAHPVKGTAYLSDRAKKVKRVFPVETDNDFVVKIPLEGLEKGQWKVNFVWEYDDRLYDYSALVTLS